MELFWKSSEVADPPLEGLPLPCQTNPILTQKKLFRNCQSYAWPQVDIRTKILECLYSLKVRWQHRLWQHRLSCGPVIVDHEMCGYCGPISLKILWSPPSETEGTIRK